MTKIQKKSYITILKESFIPDYRQVNIIREYLDANFVKEVSSDIDSNGSLIDKVMFGIKSKGDVVNYINADELLMRLEHKFSNIVKDKEDRKKFLKQIIVDWTNNTISYNGVLSTNEIK